MSFASVVIYQGVIASAPLGTSLKLYVRRDSQWGQWATKGQGNAHDATKKWRSGVKPTGSIARIL